MINKNIERYITAFRVATFTFATLLLIRYGDELYTWNNAMITTCLFVASIIMICFTYNNLDEKKILTVCILETVGIGSLLLFSSCCYNYYFWMMLNPLLLAAHKLTGVGRRRFIMSYCLSIVVLIIYTNIYVQVVLVNRNHMIFGFFSVFSFAVILTVIIEQLNDTMQKLKKTKDDLKISLGVNEALYNNLMRSNHLIDQLSNVESFDQSIEILKSHLMQWEIVGGKFLVIVDDYDNTVELSINIDTDKLNEIITKYKNHEFENIVESCDMSNENILITKNTCDDKRILFGTIFSKDIIADEYVYKHRLLFIRRQFSTQFSRMKLLVCKETLLISEEQNRIAEEIHDNINQQIFAASCLAYNIESKISKISKINFTGIDSQIHTLCETLTDTNKDLKSIIYHMSLDKSSRFTQADKLNTYLSDLSNIYDIDIQQCIFNKFDDFDYNFKYCLFRIINEGIANAVKHGRCSNAYVAINKSEETVILEIIDNGIGFIIDDLNVNEHGIGLENMKRICSRYNGSFNISSEIGGGTAIKIKMKVNYG